MIYCADMSGMNEVEFTCDKIVHHSRLLKG